MPTLDERIRKLEDRAEIQDLAAAYFLATDDDDYEALRACFIRDARFHANGFDGTTGRDSIIAFLKEARSGMGQTVHTIDYAHVRLSGADKATGIVTAHLELGIGATTVFAAVRYIDEYAREDGIWRIAAREMKAVYVSPWGNVANSLIQEKNVCWPGAEPSSSDLPRPNSATLRARK
jgi:uncharacterized protein (TIGR02246 family)